MKNGRFLDSGILGEMKNETLCFVVYARAAGVAVCCVVWLCICFVV